MKIGILTLQYANNYGALLQTYALKYYLENKGQDVEIINYSPDMLANEYSLNPMKCANNLRGRVSNALMIGRKYKSMRLFATFRKAFLNIEDNDKVKDAVAFTKLINNYDLCIVGSDQVWNNDIVRNDTIYFGDFKRDRTRICTYAASIGKSQLDEFQVALFQKTLQRFDSISVRENKAKKNLSTIAPELNIQVVLDPVFLISENDWAAIEKAPIDINGNTPYLLYYCLQKNEDMEKEALEVAQKNKLRVLTIHPTNNFKTDIGEKIQHVGPQEFIWLINHAEYVVTNSFHAAAFSIIFHKVLVPHLHSKTGNRLQELLWHFQEADNNKYDFKNCDMSNFNGFIGASKKYLNNILKE